MGGVRKRSKEGGVRKGVGRAEEGGEEGGQAGVMHLVRKGGQAIALLYSNHDLFISPLACRQQPTRHALPNP